MPAVENLLVAEDDGVDVDVAVDVEVWKEIGRASCRERVF